MYFNFFQIHHMDYPGLGFDKLKYTNAYLLLIQRGQSYLDSCTDLISNWLHPEIFHHWIRNSEVWYQSTVSCLQITVVISNRRDIYIHTLHELLLTAECFTIDHVRCECTLTFHLYAILMSSYSLIKRTTNPYGT